MRLHVSSEHGLMHKALQAALRHYATVLNMSTSTLSTITSKRPLCGTTCIALTQCIGEGLLYASRLAVGQALWPFATAALRPLRPLAACRENRPFLSIKFWQVLQSRALLKQTAVVQILKTVRAGTSTSCLAVRRT